jgi:isopentenyl-diphosphate delta-isomerase
MEEKVILVDENDKQVGTEEKLKAHQKGLLHRAFSIFIFNSQGEMLIHERAKTKYHSGGLWTNACCSHPREGETIEQAAHRRLQEEFGFACPLKEVFSFTYKAELDHGLTEHEFDHVLVGKYDGPIEKPNPEEIDNWCYIRMQDLQDELADRGHLFTVWFKIAVAEALKRGIFPI